MSTAAPLPAGGAAPRPSPQAFVAVAAHPTPGRVLALRACAGLYVLLAAWLALHGAALAPTEGGPFGAYLPAESIAVLRLRDVDALLRTVESERGILQDVDEFLAALEADAGLRQVFAREDDPDHWPAALQKQRAKLKRREEEGRRRLERIPGFVRRLFSLEPQDLRRLLETEVAVALVAPPPPESAGEGLSLHRPGAGGLILMRLHDGLGALARLVAPFRFAENENLTWHDLGGGVVAVGFDGARPALWAPEAAETVAESPAAAGIFGELTLRPRLLARSWPVNLLQALTALPTLHEVFALPATPEELRLALRAPQEGGLAVEGTWRGALPVLDGPPPLLENIASMAGTPCFEACVPLQPGAAFKRWLDTQMEKAKERRKWEVRLARLAEAGVHLDRDLWPAFGRTVRLAVYPPAEAAAGELAKILCSVSFDAQAASSKALAEFLRARWDFLFDGRPPPGQAPRSYVRRFRSATEERFVLVKKMPPIPMLLTGAQTLAGVSDAGAEAVVTGALEWSWSQAASEPAPARPRAFLRSDGARLAPQVATYVQTLLEDERDRDDMGAAKFMERFPDEAAVIRLAERLTQLTGEIHLELRPAQGAEEQGLGILTGRWRPQPAPHNP